MPDAVTVREILLYSEKVALSDVKNFFNQILKSRIPLFGFIDFSDIFSLNVVNIIIKKNMNTIRFFARDKSSLGALSLLVFPYKISEPLSLEKAKGSFLPFPKFYFLPGNQNFLDFSVKENLLEINLRIMKIFGKFLGYGTAIDEGGRKSLLISTTPEKFMQVDMEQNPAVFIDILDPIPKRMSLTSEYPVFEDTGISVGVDNFDVFQHTLFVGASGTGKSKGLYSMIKAIEAKYGNNVKMVLIDPHGEFIKCFSEYKVVNLIDNYIEPLDVGGVKTPQMTQLISQLLSSAIGQENKYSERVLFYATHLLSAVDKMSLKNISLLLTDSSKRAEFISECDNDEVKRFFDEEFNDLYIHHFNDAVLPILNFVGEYELYLGGDKKHEDLLDLIKNNRITIVSFNPNFFGKRMINFLAGAIINQMYILAITERLSQPTILVVDEFQRVETKVVKDILSETRKFNLYAYISMQYLGQLSKEVSDSVISNIRNIISFKANRQDATMLSSIMEIKIEESFKKARSQTELEESKKEMFVRLHQRECIVRLFDGKKYILPMKLKVVDVARWGYKEVRPPEPKPHPSLVKAGAILPDSASAEPETPPEEQPSHETSPPESGNRRERAQGAHESEHKGAQAEHDEEEVIRPQPEKVGQDWMGLKDDSDFGRHSAKEKESEEESESHDSEDEGIYKGEQELPQEKENSGAQDSEKEETGEPSEEEQMDEPTESSGDEGHVHLSLKEQLARLKKMKEKAQRELDSESSAPDEPSEDEVAEKESELMLGAEESEAPQEEEQQPDEEQPAEETPSEEEEAPVAKQKKLKPVKKPTMELPVKQKAKKKRQEVEEETFGAEETQEDEPDEPEPPPEERHVPLAKSFYKKPAEKPMAKLVAKPIAKKGAKIQPKGKAAPVQKKASSNFSRRK